MKGDFLEQLTNALPGILSFVAGSTFIIYFIASLVVKKYLDPKRTLLKRWDFLGATIVTLLTAVSMIVLMEINKDISYFPQIASEKHIGLYYFVQVIYSVTISSIMYKNFRHFLYEMVWPVKL